MLWINAKRRLLRYRVREAPFAALTVPAQDASQRRSLYRPLHLSRLCEATTGGAAASVLDGA